VLGVKSFLERFFSSLGSEEVESLSQPAKGGKSDPPQKEKEGKESEIESATEHHIVHHPEIKKG